MKDAQAVRNLADIVSQHKNEDILLVVSAMGKTTNNMEKLLAEFRAHDGDLGMDALSDVIAYHDGIINDLFGDDTNPDFAEDIARLFIHPDALQHSLGLATFLDFLHFGLLTGTTNKENDCQYD